MIDSIKVGYFRYDVIYADDMLDYMGQLAHVDNDIFRLLVRSDVSPERQVYLVFERAWGAWLTSAGSRHKPNRLSRMAALMLAMMRHNHLLNGFALPERDTLYIPPYHFKLIRDSDGDEKQNNRHGTFN